MDTHLNTHRRLFGRDRWKAPLAAFAAALLLAGAAWRGVPANAAPPAPAGAVSAAPAISHAIAGGRDSYADVVKVVGPAVVTVRTEGKSKASPTGFDDDLFKRFFGDGPGFGPGLGPGLEGRRPRAFKQHGLGSGVIVSGDGYILTNHHVIDGAEDIRVDLTDGRTLAAKLVGSDKPTDLAVLKIAASDLHPLALGNSEQVQVGDVVLAVGNPLGIGQTVTMGIISAKGRSTAVGGGSYEDFLQTDAPINHGNSGGALVNTKGELVGINSQIMSTSDGNIGIGFAIPANMASHVMDELRQHGRVHRAQLGVSVQQVTSDMASSLGLKQVGGVIVSAVTPGSAAERAGIRRGDVIQSFNGQPVQDTNSLRNRVASAQPGSTATVVIVRDGGARDVTVKLDEAAREKSARGASESGSEDHTALGVTVAPLTPELAARAGAPKDARGLLVEEVSPDGRAANAGIQAGDIIEEVNRQPVQTVDQLRAAVQRTADRPVLVLVQRQGQSLFVTVRPANS